MNMDDSDIDSDSSVEEERQEESLSSRIKRKRPKQVQAFVDGWLTDKQFKGWLCKRIGKGNTSQPFCKVCDKFLACSKTSLKRHLATSLHQNRSATTGTTSTITSLFTKAASQEQTSSMEIKLCAFLAEHNLPISLSDDLLDFLRSLFPLDNTLKNVTLGKQKATNVIRQVLGFDYLKDAVMTLRSKKFSFIIDETTDKSTAKQLAILATYFDMESFQLKQFLLDMVEVKDGTAKGIYSAVKQSFADLHVPMSNIIGYSSDTTNVMFGQFNSVAQLLKEEFPDVITVKCSCHLIHLASSQAALKLPKGLEDLCRDIFSHFSRSSKRQDTYEQFQQFFNVEPLQLLSPGQTRWLSLESCVNRILEQYSALQHYFVLVANEDPTHATDRIVKLLHNKFTLAYLEFLSYQLQRFNDFNRLFQSERPLLQSLKDEVEGLVKSISSDFMEVRHVKVTNAKDINPKNVTFHLPLKDVYVGVAATATLHEIKKETSEDDVDLQNFLLNCRNFLIESIEQIQRRFDLDAEIHDVVQCTLPQKAAARVPASLASVVKKLPYLNAILDTTKLDGEWRQHVFEENLNPELHWEEYWMAVRNAKVSSGEPKYPNLSKFVEVVASFPFSNAAVERVFSLLKRIKTDDRTRLKSSSLVSLLQCKLAMKNGKYNAATLKPTKEAVELSSKMKSSATDGEAKELRKQFLDKLFS